MKLGNIAFLVGIASLLQISSVSGAALRNRNRVEGEICNTVLKNYSDKTHIEANCDWAEQIEQQKLESQAENSDGDKQDEQDIIPPEPESAQVRRVPGANLSLPTLNSGLTAQKPPTSGINFIEGADQVLDGVSGTYGKPPSSYAQIPSSSLPNLSTPSNLSSEFQPSPNSHLPNNQLGTQQIGNVQQALSAVENILTLANPAENPLTVSQQSDYEDYPLLGAAAGGWAPSEAAVNVPTLLMETSLNIGSAAAVSTSHSEYLNLAGDHENPAYADVLFGSNSHHTLHGTIVQQSFGSDNGTQHNEGWVDGGSSQMYEIAVMGDHNDISVGGSSDALGMATVVQESLSDTLFGSGGAEVAETLPAPEMEDVHINSEGVLTAAEVIAQPEPEQAITITAANDDLWEDLLTASNAAEYVVPEPEHLPEAENEENYTQHLEAEEILANSEHADVDNSQTSEVLAELSDNISEPQEISVGEVSAEDLHLPELIANDINISEDDVLTAEAEPALLDVQPESVVIAAEPAHSLFFGKPESPPFQGKPEASLIFEESSLFQIPLESSPFDGKPDSSIFDGQPEPFLVDDTLESSLIQIPLESSLIQIPLESSLIQIPLESSPFAGKPDASVFDGRPEPFLLYGAPESFQLGNGQLTPQQPSINSILGEGSELLENEQEAPSNEEKVEVEEPLIPQQPSSNSIFEEDSSEPLETEVVHPQSSEEEVADSQSEFVVSEFLEEAIQTSEDEIPQPQQEINNVLSVEEPESEVEFQDNSGHQEANEPESDDFAPNFLLAASPELQLLGGGDEFQYATDEHIEVPSENFNHNNEDFNQILPHEIIPVDKPHSTHENVVAEQKPDIVEVYGGNADLDFSSLAEQIVTQLSGENPPIVEIDTGEDEFNNNSEEDGLQASVLQ